MPSRGRMRDHNYNRAGGQSLRQRCVTRVVDCLGPLAERAVSAGAVVKRSEAEYERGLKRGLRAAQQIVTGLPKPGDLGTL
jgi:hypothetical protein